MKKYYFFPKVGYAVILSLALSSLFSQPVAAQSCPTNGSTNVNTYPGTYFSISGGDLPAGSTSIALSSATYGSTPISKGDILLIIQMQGAQINAVNTSNYGASNGTGSGYLNNTNLLAGNMEYVIANNNVSLGGGTLNLTSPLVNGYKNQSATSTDGQYRFQVIRIGVFYDLKLTGTITAPRWDGSNGGVVVLYATDNIDLNGQTIDASGLGFRGGGGRSLSGAGSGANTDYYTLSSSNANGSKGEGIAGTPKYTNNSSNNALDVAPNEGYPNGSYAMGAPGNAGGGGTDGNPSNSNDQNTGGGGGSNGGAGGGGGKAWSSGILSGGKAGAVFAQASASRIVMGGGGGAGTT
ncbi:MAG TPA: hypothetical protein VI233_06355, partial [Puia sp.]